MSESESEESPQGFDSVGDLMASDAPPTSIASASGEVNDNDSDGSFDSQCVAKSYHGGFDDDNLPSDDEAGPSIQCSCHCVLGCIVTYRCHH